MQNTDLPAATAKHLVDKSTGTNNITAHIHRSKPLLRWTGTQLGPVEVHAIGTCNTVCRYQIVKVCLLASDDGLLDTQYVQNSMQGQ